MLTPIESPAKERRIATYDLEWVPHTLELRLAGFYDGEQYWAFKTVAELLGHMLRREYEGVWMYAHAGGLYDLRFLLDFLITQPQYEIEAIFSGSSAIIVKIRKGDQEWVLLDSFWTLRTSLRELGTMTGIAKGNADESLEFFASASWQTLREYNAIDCRILYEAIKRFEHTTLELGGELQMTVASTAMRLFRRKYLSETIPTSDAINLVAREGYIASRVEPFARECREALGYDINSSFPHSMRAVPHPGRFAGRSKRPLAGAIPIIKARIYVPESELPPLPYRSSKGRVFFPVGTWDATLYRSDLLAMVLGGARVERIYEVYNFYPSYDLAQYAENIYALRKASTDEGERYILKIFLNSLYGKFAEREEKEKILINPHNYPQGARLIQPGIYAVTEIREVPHAHVPFAGSITSHARLTLYEHMMRCSKVYYVDTDSILCSRDNVFPTSNELGGLKLEKEIKRGQFAAPKLYALTNDEGEYTIRAKGFSRVKRDDGKATKPTYEDFLKLAAGEELLLERFARVREGLKTGRGPEQYLTGKRLRGKLRPKRCFDGDGSRPWNVKELVDE